MPPPRLRKILARLRTSSAGAVVAPADGMAAFETVLRTPDLGPGNIAEVHVRGHDLAVANVGQTYYAFDARCPIDGTNLARVGRLEGDLLICPHDNARFDVRSGARVDGRDGALRAHEIRVHGNDVRVRIDDV